MTPPADAPGGRPRGDSRRVELPRGRLLLLGSRALVMGVVNATPDSFYAASRVTRPDLAVERALAMVECGADIVDIGGESTRPGSEGVSAEEEIERVLPVIEGVRKASSVAISIDTRKASVALAAVESGADIVNDVSGFGADPDMHAVLAATHAIGILMHMRGAPRTMAGEASYEDVVLEIKAEIGKRLSAAVKAGVPSDRIWIDPGIGFAKNPRHNFEILARLDELLVFERPIVVGASRKSFVGRALREPDPACRLEGSLAAAVAARLAGADVLRVHDVAETRRALDVADAILDPSRAEEP